MRLATVAITDIDVAGSRARAALATEACHLDVARGMQLFRRGTFKRAGVGFCMVALMLVFASASAAAHRAAGARCRPGHPHPLAVDTQAQVYSMVEYNGFREVLGCVYGRRPYFLGYPPEHVLSPGGGGGVELITLAGSIVAYQYSRFGEVGWASWMVVVRNLRTGRLEHRISTGRLEEPNPNPDSAGIGPALSMAVKSDGSVAWIAEDRFLSENKPSYYQIHAVDKTGSRVLAAGTGIDPKSLALASSTLYWLQEGKAMSTTLN